MALITDYLKVSDALDEQREKPFAFRANRFDQFKTENDGLREMYVENQRVPERLSATKFNNLSNKYKFDDLSANYDTDLETSRLDSQFGLGASRFKLDNQGRDNELTRTATESGIIGNNNKIIQAEAEQEYFDIVQRIPYDNNSDPKEYVSRLLNETQNPRTKLMIEEEARKIFTPEIMSMNTFAKAIENLEALPDETSSGNPNPKVGPARERVIRLFDRMDWENLEYLAANNLMTREQSVLYDALMDYKVQIDANRPSQEGQQTTTTQTSVVQPVVTPVVTDPNSTPAVNPNAAPVLPTDPVVPTNPSDVVTSDPNITAPASQPVPQKIIPDTVPLLDSGTNPVLERMISIDPQYELLNSPLTRENYKEFDTLLSRLKDTDVSGTQGQAVLDALGLTDQHLLSIGNQIEIYENMDMQEGVSNLGETYVPVDVNNLTPDQVVNLNIIGQTYPELVELLTQGMNNTNYRRFEQQIDAYLGDAETPEEVTERTKILADAGVNLNEVVEITDKYISNGPFNDNDIYFRINNIPENEHRETMIELMKFDPSSDISKDDAQELIDDLFIYGHGSGFGNDQEYVDKVLEVLKYIESKEGD